MNLENTNRWLTLTANIGVLAGIVFLAIEVGQNQEALEESNLINERTLAVTTSQAILDSTQIMDSSYRARAQNAALDELINIGHSSISSLSERERSQFFAWLRADMNSAESLWFFYDRGIISEEDFDGMIASFCSRVITPGGQQWWHAEKEFFAGGFRENIDSWCFPFTQ